MTSQVAYPSLPGVCLSLGPLGNLGDFGSPARVIYVGIAKDSLRDRDLRQHFADGQTGRSTLRRSLGAVLKTKLGLTAIPRGGPNDSKRFENYRFDDAGERALTRWMIDNVELGYWCASPKLSYEDLRSNEYETIMLLRPTLDLDRRTRAHNPLADRLTDLRRVCQREAALHG